jgi:hypothetical protein
VGARPGARLYNVQVFLLRPDNRTVKVLSAFPRGNRMLMPARRLAPGRRYVWRVWPYLGNRYTLRPLGMSWFRVVPPPA